MSKLIYTTKRFKFDEPAKMQEKMLEYLIYVDKRNADYTTKYCKNCGFIWDEQTVKCCDDPNIEFRLVHKPTYEHIRPTLFGFCAYCGLSMSGYRKYQTYDGFDEVAEWFNTVLQMDLEQLLLNPFNRNVGGAKFVAINNFGWKDKTYVESFDAGKVVFVNDTRGSLEEVNTELLGESDARD